MTRVETYVAAMKRAAKGSHQAAGAILAGGWLPGDWRSKSDRQSVIDYARDMGY